MLTAAKLVDYLVDTVAKNGNVLINVGPDSYGHIPDIQQAPLLGLGDWMHINGEAIYATRPWIRFRNARGRALRYTQSDTALYAIVIGGVEQSFTIEQPGIASRSIDVLRCRGCSHTRARRTTNSIPEQASDESCRGGAL